MTKTMLPETTIRYTVGPLGLVGSQSTVGEGDLGRVLGPTANEGWYYTEPVNHPGAVCPVTPGMVEVVA
jgi:hypothetical protein